MENNRVSPETIDKYYDCLVELKNLLSYTSRISLDGFCKRKNLSKSFSQVLSKGGIIKCTVKGKYSEWEWTSIDPTKQMALKAIQMLSEYNPPRKRVYQKKTVLVEKEINKTSKEKNDDPKKEVLERQKYINIKLFWGLISFNINI